MYIYSSTVPHPYPPLITRKTLCYHFYLWMFVGQIWTRLFCQTASNSILFKILGFESEVSLCLKVLSTSSCSGVFPLLFYMSIELGLPGWCSNHKKNHIISLWGFKSLKSTERCFEHLTLCSKKSPSRDSLNQQVTRVHLVSLDQWQKLNIERSWIRL